jgi:hypothetical protein
MLLNFSDFLILPIYLFIIYNIGKNFQNKRIVDNPVYSYYLRGLFLKIGGGIFLVLIYTVYYQGGDTTAYFESALILDKLRQVNFDAYLEIMSNNLNKQTYSYFTTETAWPQYFFDKQSFTVVRVANIVNFLGFNSYMLTTVVLASLTYNGIWRLFLLFSELYPKYVKQLSYSILYIPSVLFWGSGILKDTLTLMGACWFTFSFYKVFIKREQMIVNFFTMIFSAWVILQMKPYIFIALVPGALLWFSFDKIQSISNPVIKFLVAPLVIATFLGIGGLALSSISSSFGQYSSVDKIVDKAITTQKDLKMDYNKGNSFDIGEFDGSAGSIGRKFPIATFAGLFFPQFWHVKNLVMLLAAIENTIILMLTIFLLVKVGPVNVYNQIRKEPLLTFSIIFSVFFAFSVGLTTSNFGALVRYKIPAVPFYLSTILILYEKNKQGDFETELAKE